MRRKKNRGPRPPRGAAPKIDAGSGELLAALALLRQRRAPYAELLAGIVGETLQDFPPPPERTRVSIGAEIGAGTGQLRGWLPAAVRSTTVHTDPSPEALRVLSAGAPEASVAVAAAEHLPFASGALGSVLALCVFDAVAAVNQPAVVAEIARVLCPGGRFVHFLDMATLLDAPFTKLVASGLIPIPNVFGDPADHDAPSDGTSVGSSDGTSDWPRDVLLVKRDWLSGLLDFTRRMGHPLFHRFGPYFAAFVAPGGAFDVVLATDRFKALASSGPDRQAFAALLTSACQLAFQSGYPPIDPLPFHSGRYLASVLEASFRENGGFHISRCEISARALWRPPSPGEATRYRSLCLGHQRVMDHLPRRLLSESAKVWATAQPEPATLAAGEMLVEAGVFVFVATRL